MKISSIEVYQVKYGLQDLKYSWSNDLFITAVASNIVRVLTDDGIDGFGEVCPLGPAYMDAFAEGVPAAIGVLSPALMGADPRDLNLIHERMNLALGGHNYAKSPIDVACWDILGKSANLPVATLLGGRYRDEVPLYRAIPQRSPEEMSDDVARYREKGYRRFQLKVGGSVSDDIRRIRSCRDRLEETDILVADANTGWIPQEAIRVCNAVKDLDVFIEQPCATLWECLAVRRSTSLPFVLDEVIRGVGTLLEAHREQAMDAVNLKISRLGGLTPAKAAEIFVRHLASQ